MDQNDIAKKEKNTSSPVEKEQIAKKVESNANVVGGVCAKDGDADGEEGGVVEGDQAVHDHLQGVVVLVGEMSSFVAKICVAVATLYSHVLDMLRQYTTSATLFEATLLQMEVKMRTLASLTMVMAMPSTH